jgi:hypothetical protein
MIGYMNDITDIVRVTNRIRQTSFNSRVWLIGRSVGHDDDDYERMMIKKKKTGITV